MDSRQAREILSRYRPGDSSSGDPRMAEALELARSDPQLAIWFGQHCAKHVVLPGDAPAFVATVPSTALANRDRAAAAAAEADAALTQPAHGRERVVSVNKVVLSLLAIAGLVALSYYLYVRFTPLPANTFDNYRERMARLVQRTYPVKITTTDPAKVRDYFRANGGVIDYTVPRSLQKLPALGGAVLAWENQPVSMLALDGGTNNGVNTNLYLFFINRSAFQTNTYPVAVEYLVVGQCMTASWAEADTIYLFAGPNDRNLAKNYVEP